MLQKVKTTRARKKYFRRHVVCLHTEQIGCGKFLKSAPCWATPLTTWRNCVQSPYINSSHLTSFYITLYHLLSSHFLTSHLISPYLISTHLTLPRFTSPYITLLSSHSLTSHFTLPYLISSHLISPTSYCPDMIYDLIYVVLPNLTIKKQTLSNSLRKLITASDLLSVNFSKRVFSPSVKYFLSRSITLMEIRTSADKKDLRWITMRQRRIVRY